MSGETVAATAEQTAAISATGLSIALASGAGCGKTTVLTQRFLALLEGEHRHPLSQLVALTFTTKAARELRDRSIPTALLALEVELQEIHVGRLDTLSSVCRRPIHRHLYYQRRLDILCRCALCVLRCV